MCVRGSFNYRIILTVIGVVRIFNFNFWIFDKMWFSRNFPPSSNVRLVNIKVVLIISYLFAVGKSITAAAHLRLLPCTWLICPRDRNCINPFQKERRAPARPYRWLSVCLSALTDAIFFPLHSEALMDDSSSGLLKQADAGALGSGCSALFPFSWGITLEQWSSAWAILPYPRGLIVTMGGQCYWPLVVRSQEYGSASCDAQGGTPTQKCHPPQVIIVLRSNKPALEHPIRFDM